ncbi:hypothetical protein HFN_0673 [Helicobacter fennelliae MRY12-0050]|uniref:Uncharacterized protein n=1 Tax=Helicobacter fennelliae MRY12-0050 TaxID=1325130 RepID=T1DUJ1_9HELI|nr:hypothetical protein HFN_0673 [Helicobacter fennelliae MRY12-0050]
MLISILFCSKSKEILLHFLLNSLYLLLNLLTPSATISFIFINLPFLKFYKYNKKAKK